jgi:hypothetical protein
MVMEKEQGHGLEFSHGNKLFFSRDFYTIEISVEWKRQMKLKKFYEISFIELDSEREKIWKSLRLEFTQKAEFLWHARKGKVYVTQRIENNSSGVFSSTFSPLMFVSRKTNLIKKFPTSWRSTSWFMDVYLMHYWWTTNATLFDKVEKGEIFIYARHMIEVPRKSELFFTEKDESSHFLYFRAWMINCENIRCVRVGVSSQKPREDLAVNCAMMRKMSDAHLYKLFLQRYFLSYQKRHGWRLR